MKADAATIAVQLDAETRRVAEQSIAQAKDALAQVERALDQRDEARLRVNLMSLATGHAMIYPVPERHAELVAALVAALEPVR
jgi:hypothetical protein